MSLIAADLAGLVRERGRGGLAHTVSDIANVTRRNLIKIFRIPQYIVFSTIQPVMILLLFTYVFGGTINIPGVKYVDFVVPAVLIQTTTFAAMSTGFGLATDLQTGMVDRFRSLPIARSAVLAGRTFADGARTLFQVLLMVVVAHIVGFRFHAGVAPAFALVATAVVFGFAFSWISAFIGLAVRDPETAQVAGFVWVFPLTFASAAFVPLEALPGWMQSFARVNPISSTAAAMRSFALGGPTFTHVWHTFLWLGAIIAVFSILSVRVYRRVV